MAAPGGTGVERPGEPRRLTAAARQCEWLQGQNSRLLVHAASRDGVGGGLSLRSVLKPTTAKVQRTQHLHPTPARLRDGRRARDATGYARVHKAVWNVLGTSAVFAGVASPGRRRSRLWWPATNEPNFG